jgi:hypothetical protein
VSLPFDRVELKGLEGKRDLTVRQFCSLPLHERLRAVLENRVSFFLGDQLVDSREALKALRERAV